MATLATVWQEHMANLSNPPAVPDIPFNQETVIAVFLGARPTGGYSISIDTVEETSDSTVVSVTVTIPGPAAIVTQAFTSAYHFVKMPKTQKVVSFRTVVKVPGN